MAKLWLSQDGISSFEAIEYERLDQVLAFSKGMLLLLQPPLEVKRGLVLLRKQNVKIIAEPEHADIEIKGVKSDGVL